MTLLAQGFVIGFNQSGFQLLTLDGNEVFISNESIWKIEIAREANQIHKNKTPDKKYVFSHPQRGRCEETHQTGVLIYPSELMSDPVTIKKKFDAQIAAFKKVSDYEEAQSFYAVPQIYKNFTSVGYWLPIGSRYGTSSGRNGVLAPLIRNEYSQGPFSYQHLSLTGSGPVPDSIHEEPQTMLYYGFKSSYVHFAGFIDPSLILAGSNYQWQDEDFGGLDEKVVEASYISLGFDRGPFSISFFLNSHIFGGFSRENKFTRYSTDLFRLGLGWQTARLNLKFNTSLSDSTDVQNDNGSNWSGTFKFVRLSATYQFSELWNGEAFYFSRSLNARDANNPDEFKGASQTIGLGTYHNLTRRWQVGGRVSLEQTDNKSMNQSNKADYVKMGLHASMNF